MAHKVQDLGISYLRYYKSDFDTVKSKVDQLHENSPTSYKDRLELVLHKVRELAISYLRYYKSDFDTVKSEVCLMRTFHLAIKLASS